MNDFATERQAYLNGTVTRDEFLSRVAELEAKQAPRPEQKELGRVARVVSVVALVLGAFGSAFVSGTHED